MLAEAEGEAGQAEKGEAAEHGRPRPDPRHEHPGRECRDQRPSRVGPLEHARLSLTQVELGDVVREQRSDRRVERDVEEDHRRGEDEQPAHPPIQSPTLTRPTPEGWQSG